MKQMTSSTAAAACHYDTCRCAARQSGFRIKIMLKQELDFDPIPLSRIKG